MIFIPFIFLLAMVEIIRKTFNLSVLHNHEGISDDISFFPHVFGSSTYINYVTTNGKHCPTYMNWVLMADKRQRPKLFLECEKWLIF